MATTCAESVYDTSTTFGKLRNCERKAGHGPDGKYCAQHAEKYADASDTVTWYCVNNSEYAFKITPVQVIKETESNLLIRENGRNLREAKRSRFSVYFKTKDEAVAFYQNRIDGLVTQAAKLQKQLDGMKW